MVDYVRPGAPWQEWPSTATPVPAAWLTGVDDSLTDLGGASGRVKALETGLAAKAADAAVVHVTGAETVGGQKTFTSSPVVPTATTAGQAANLGNITAAINALVNGAPGALDTLKEIADQLAADESAAAALTTTVAGKLAKASNLGDLTDAAAARGNLGLGGSATRAVGTTAGTVAAGDDARIVGAAQKSANLTDLADPVAARSALGIVGTGDLSEAAAAARTTAATASALVGKTTRYDTSGGAIPQPLPAAVAGAVLAIGWETGTAALSYTGATRSDTCATTSGSATVTDTSIVAADQGRVVTGAGIPANTYVGTVTPGASFLLSSSPTSQANVTATATAASVNLAITDAIGPAATTSATIPVTGEIVTLHCTTPGRWRAVAAFRPLSSLDARYAGIAAQAPNVTLTDAATILIDATLGNRHKVILTASGHVLDNPSGGYDGQILVITVVQDATGGRVPTLGSKYNAGAGSAPTFSTGAGKRDRLAIQRDATADKWDIVGFAAGF